MMATDPKPPMAIVSWIVKGKITGGTKRGLFTSPGTNALYYAQTSTPTGLAQDIDAWQWDIQPRPIDFMQVYPRYDPSSMTVANRDRAFEKQLDLLALGPRLFDSSESAMVTMREITIGEMLRKHPHPNICVYRGVVVNTNNLVSGIVFDRYDMTLYDLVEYRHQFDGKACIRAVEKGIKHLHSLGYIHYDLKPENILYSMRDKRFVLGDFDTSQRIGTRLELKHGAEGWRPPFVTKDDVAHPEYDWYGVKVLKFWLKKKGNGKAKRHQKLPRTKDIVAEITMMLEKK
jgi:serine/threonine protein kinase